jgi:hypothetical protein
MISIQGRPGLRGDVGFPGADGSTSSGIQGGRGDPGMITDKKFSIYFIII